jgi:hypothetical protein
LGPGELVGEPRGEVSHGALVSVEARGFEVRVTWWILMDMVIGTRSRDCGLEMWGVGRSCQWRLGWRWEPERLDGVRPRIQRHFLGYFWKVWLTQINPDMA